MTTIKNGLIVRQGGTNQAKKKVFYDWFPVRYYSTNKGCIQLGKLIVPKEYVGKRIKIKVEVLK